MSIPETRLGVYGLGKLGLPLAASFAAAGISTFGVDIDTEHVEALRKGGVPFDEPGLECLLRQAAERLSFHTKPDGLELSASLVQVPTPSSPDRPQFSAHMVANAVRMICGEIERRPIPPEQHLIVIASTVMPGTLAAEIRPLLEAAQRRSECSFDLAYVPDLVAIGDVVRGFRTPPVLIIGADNEKTAQLVNTMYGKVVTDETRRAMLTLAEAEITKIAWNFYLCFRISYANMLARLTQHSPVADVDKVTETLSLDPRFGRGFFKAGMPFGGPCFPRDVEAMRTFLAAAGEDDAIACAVKQSNERHYDFIADAALARSSSSIGVLGLSFKAGTDVTIESPSFKLMHRLLAANVAVRAWDPAERARQALIEDASLTGAALAETAEELFNSCDVIILAVCDSALAKFCGAAHPGSVIIDPWGLLPEDAVNVVRPGRTSSVF